MSQVTAGYRSVMSENKGESTDPTATESTDDSRDSSDDSGVGITDDQLPDDLVPSEDNPLAEGLPAGETAEDLREKRATGESDDGS